MRQPLADSQGEHKEPAFPPIVHEGQPMDGVSPMDGVTDMLKVPPSLKPGRYVLGLRYDCEVCALHFHATQKSEEQLLCDNIVCCRRQAIAQLETP